MDNAAQERVLALVRERLQVEEDDYAALAVKTGFVPPRALSAQTRWTTDQGKIRKLRYWSKGAHEMPFGDAMQILAAANLLDPDLERAWRGE